MATSNKQNKRVNEESKEEQEEKNHCQTPRSIYRSFIIFSILSPDFYSLLKVPHQEKKLGYLFQEWPR